jgi:hypothetical protein
MKLKTLANAAAAGAVGAALLLGSSVAFAQTQLQYDTGRAGSGSAGSVIPQTTTADGTTGNASGAGTNAGATGTTGTMGTPGVPNTGTSGTMGSSGTGGTTTPGVPNTGAGDAATLVALGIAGLIAVGGTAYMMRRQQLV